MCIATSALSIPLSSLERAYSKGKAAGRAAARAALRERTWRRITADWAPFDSWLIDAAGEARRALPDVPEVAASWWDGIRAGWNGCGPEFHREAS